MKRIKTLALIMLAGIVAASAFFAPAQADPKQKITVTCTANGTASINNNNGTTSVTGNCTVSPTNFTGNSSLDIKINAAGGVVVDVAITDGTGSKYEIKGDASDDTVWYFDAAGNDKVEFDGKGGFNMFHVTDTASNDKYQAKKIGHVLFTDAPPPGDKDKIEIN